MDLLSQTCSVYEKTFTSLVAVSLCEIADYPMVNFNVLV